MIHSKLGFGVVGSLDLETVRTIAIRAEELRYHSLWFNDTPGGDSLERIALAARVTTSLTLGTGVISVDRVAPSTIVDRVAALEIPVDRFILGVGCSAPPSPLSTMRDALELLRGELACPVIVGSLGPRMRRLAAERAEGVLFNWLPPEFTERTTEELRTQAGHRSHSAIAATYVRTALGEESRSALEAEADRYSSIPSYAANFERLGITAMQSTVHGSSYEEIAQGLRAFDGTVDHVVLRAITPSDDLDHYLALLEAGAATAG